MNISEQVELAWHFDPLQPRGPDGKWVSRGKQRQMLDDELNRRMHKADRIVAQHRFRRAQQATWTIGPAGDIVRGAHGNTEADLRAKGKAGRVVSWLGTPQPASRHGDWQFLGLHGDFPSRFGREPQVGDIARANPNRAVEGRVVGRVVAKAGGHAVVDGDDGNRHLIDWRNGGVARQTQPLSQMPAIGGPAWARAMAGHHSNSLLGSPVPMERLVPGAQARAAAIIGPGSASTPESASGLGHDSPDAQHLRAITPDELASGEEHHPAQGAQGDTVIEVLPSGETVVHKTYRPGYEDMPDADELSYYVSQALGAGSPPVARVSGGDPNEIVMGFVRGMTAERYLGDETDYEGAKYRLTHSPQGGKIGLLDYLIENPDRHNGNWMVSPDGQPVPIDNSSGFSGYGTSSPFWHGTQSYTKAELDEARSKLEQIEPEFARLGRLDWYEKMISRLDELALSKGFAGIAGQAIGLAFSPAEKRDSRGRWTRFGGLGQAAKTISHSPEGFSVSLSTGGQPAAGYMVAQTGHTHTFPAEIMADQEKLARAIDQMLMKEKKALSGPGAYLGGWVHDGKLWLEPSDNVASHDEAVRLGQARNQIAIWDVAHGQEIQTGGSGGGAITEHANSQGAGQGARELHRSAGRRADGNRPRAGQPAPAGLARQLDLSLESTGINAQIWAAWMCGE